MITQPVDPHHFVRRARQIKAQLPTILSQWGLLPKFKRWRLAQDPETGTVVLFGVLDTQYIATHGTTPFSDYFDPRLLNDLATGLHVQVISSANDGLRYAFILERGELDLPEEKIVTLVDEPAEQEPAQLAKSTLVEDHLILHRKLDKFLKVTEVLQALDNATRESQSEALLMDEADFNQQMVNFEARRNSLTLL